MAKIAIIGTGVSGLAAAVELTGTIEMRDHSITLFESRHTPGGRTRSYIDDETGDSLDNGQHLLMGCYRYTLEYLSSIGTANEVRSNLRLRVPFSIFNPYTGGARQARLRTAPLPSPLHALFGVLTTDLLDINEKLAAIRLARSVPKLLHEDRSSSWTCEELFRELRQPQGLVHKLWEPLCLATINASIVEASARAFLSVVSAVLLGSPRDASILFPKVGLSELLIDPAVELLKSRGASLNLKSPVVAIEKDPSGYSLKIGTPVRSERFDIVLLATSDGEMQLPDPVRLPEIEYSPIVNAYFWTDRKILHSPIHAFINTTLQWAFSKPSIFSAERLALTVSAATELVQRDTTEISSILWQDLRNSIPEARSARLLHYQIIKEKRATPLLTPSVFSQRPETTTPLSGFYIAGDLVQNGLPATIEGAIQNGVLAAREIARSLSAPNAPFSAPSKYPD